MDMQNLTDADRAALAECLRGWAAEGVKDPRIPLDVDLDGDGRLDAWALDGLGRLVLVPVEHLADTVFASDGEG